jgi:hypothetical protein
MPVATLRRGAHRQGRPASGRGARSPSGNYKLFLNAIAIDLVAFVALFGLTLRASSTGSLTPRQRLGILRHPSQHVAEDPAEEVIWHSVRTDNARDHETDAEQVDCDREVLGR